MTETPASSPAETDDGTVAVEAPPTAPAGAPLCYVVDDEASIRHFLSLVLHGAGIDTMEFPDGAEMRAAIGRRVPDLVFLNVSLESADAIETVIALGKNGFSGNVQLMSTRGAAVLEHVKNVGVQHHLNMLPVLKKPFETDAIVKILQDLNLGTPAAAAARIDLEEAIKNGWMEFWYQPKIDLRKKQLAGAEGYARARHPVHGIASARRFHAGRNGIERHQPVGNGAGERAQDRADVFQARRPSQAHGQYSGQCAGENAGRGDRAQISPARG